VANRVAVVHAQTRPTLLAAAGFALAAPIAALVPHRTGSWLPLHLLFVGALLTAISGGTQLLAVTWSTAPAPPARAVAVQRALVVLGAAGLAAGREADDLLVVLVPSGTAVVAALVLLAVLLVGIRRGAAQRRFEAAIDHYLAALLAGVAACAAGIVLAGEWGGDAVVRLRAAHLTTNLLGLVGLVVAGTVPFFAATQARVKLGPRLGVRSQHVTLAVLVSALALADVGILAGHPLLSAVGLAGYVAGLALMATHLPRMRAKQFRWAGARLIMLLAGIAWWAGCVAAAAARAARGLELFPETLIGALAIGGFAQILVSSLAYLGPVLRGGDHEHLSHGFRTTRSPVALAGLNVAAVAFVVGAGWVLSVALAAVALDALGRAVTLLAKRGSRTAVSDAA
jgi:hypothetical protein